MFSFKQHWIRLQDNNGRRATVLFVHSTLQTTFHSLFQCSAAHSARLLLKDDGWMVLRKTSTKWPIRTEWDWEVVGTDELLHKNAVQQAFKNNLKVLYPCE